MSLISVTATVIESFFSNYTKGTFGTSESKSGLIMAVAAAFYTIATFASGFLGFKTKVSLY